MDFVNYASKNKIYTATSTNAHYLNDENAKKTILSGLDKLIISIDGTTQETYQQYRIGGNLEKVLEGTQNLIRWKKKLKSSTPHILFQFLVVKPNEHQVEDAKKLAKNIGVDEIVFKTAQIYNYQNGSNLIPTIDYYSRYKKIEENNYVLKNKLDNKCWRMWSANVITWDGNVIPCCFDKDATHTFGNLNQLPLNSIKNNQKYNKFRSQVISDRSQIEICKNCTEGTKVWA